MNRDHERGLIEVEARAVAQHHARQHLDDLAMVPAHELSDHEAVARWRWLTSLPTAPRQPLTEAERREVVAAWRELRT